MKIHIPRLLYPTNKLKEVYYKSFLLKDVQDKFFPAGIETMPVIQTNKEIRLMDLPLGSCRKSVIRFMGAPRFSVSTPPSLTSEILFFKQQIQEEKCIVQCHFLKDQFYFAHLDFISSLSSENKKLVQLLQDKYGEADFSTDRKFAIQDVENNKIIVDLDVYLRLDYLSGKDTIKKKLKQNECNESGTQRNRMHATGRSFIEL